MPKLKTDTPSLAVARAALDLIAGCITSEPPIRLSADPAIRAGVESLLYWFNRLAASYEARANRARLNGAKGDHLGRPRITDRCPCKRFTIKTAALRRHRCEAKGE